MVETKLWVDDVRPAPEGYVWCKSVNEAKNYIQDYEEKCNVVFNRSRIAYMHDDASWERLHDEATAMLIDIIDIDHDSGNFSNDGGDYIKLLDWLEETGRNYPIRIHSMNPVGVENMRRIIQKNGWTEVR